jgi:hypothetical protein
MHDLATLFVLCMAEPDRVDSMKPLNPYRQALKDNMGKRFLEFGAKSDAEIADTLRSVNPHAILLDGFPSRPKFLDAAQHAVVGQTLTLAGSSGVTRVDFILGSEITLPEDTKHHFTEKRQLLNAPFHGNSFRQFFPDHANRLHTLRTDTNARSEERKDKFGLRPDCKILLNISSPEGLQPRFWAIMFQVLRDNSAAVLVLIDHAVAFKLRMQALFKSKGLEKRLFFVREPELHNGDLHGLLAVGDVYVDGIGSTGPTELYDALWASSVVISFQGDSLAERIGAEVLTAFGTPENLCKTDNDAVDRINQLLQNSESYENARLKSDLCRTQSSMYNSELRGRQVIAALTEAYNGKLLEQKAHENDLATTRDDLATPPSGDAMLYEVVESLRLLHIENNGQIDNDEHSVAIPAEFRGVPVLVVLPPLALWPSVDFRNNPAVREAVARDLMVMDSGDHAWTRAVPMNERDVMPNGDTKLDLISLNVRGQVLHGILLEQPTSTAASLFEDLARAWHECKGSAPESFPPGLVDRTIMAVKAQLQLLRCVHGRARSFGGDPKVHLDLSPLKDGYMKRAVATVQLAGGTSALMLGRATHMLNAESIRCHRPGCEHATPVSVHDHSRQGKQQIRKSGRYASQSASLSNSELKTRLDSPPGRTTPATSGDGGKFRCCAGYGDLRSAKRDDIRRAAQVIMNALVGQSKGPTVVERIGASGEGWGDQCTGAELYTIFLRVLDDDEFRYATGLTNQSDPFLFKMLQGKNRKFARLLDLLAKMLGSTPLEAQTLLSGEKLFDDIVVPSNKWPEGLESAPEDRRERLITCTPLMKALGNGKVQHYFVKGDKSLKWGRGPSATSKVLIDVWLCLTLEPDKGNRVFRSVRAAEPGKAGDLGALYGPPGARVVREPYNGNYIDITYILGIPNLRLYPYIEGKERGISDAPTRVKVSSVGMYLNSCKDAINVNATPANCGRLWDPEWKTFSPSNAPSFVPDDVRMGLVLLEDVKMYQELVYAYDWAKSEATSGKATKKGNVLRSLSMSGGPISLK